MPSPSPSPRAILAVLATGFVLALPAPGAGAHAAFTGSQPGPGARVEAAPARVTLEFSEPLNRRLSRARLVSARDGEAIAAGQAVAGRRLTLMPRVPLARGVYRVEWQTVSTQDAHPLQGTVGFGVAVAAGAGGGATEQSPLARDGWLRVPARAALYAALLLFCGALMLFALLGGARWLVPPASDPDARGIDREAEITRAQALVADVGVLAAGLAVGVAGLEAVSAAGSLSAGALGDYLFSGLAGAARLGVAAFVVAALALARRAPRAAALAAAGALGCVVASGHANSADPRALAVPSDFAHLVAGAVWAGGAALVAVVWGPLLGRAGPEGRRAVARHVLPAFGRVALPAFLLVVVTGTISAAVELRRVADLWQTTYGVVLSVKVALVAIAAGVAHRHARRLRPRLLGPRAPAPGVERRHWRLLRAEPLVALGVVAAAGLLVAFPLPPRQATGVVGALAAVAPCDPCPLPAPRAGELAVAGQAGSRVVAAWVRREPSALSATVRVLDSRGRPAPAPTAVAGRAGRPCGRGCAAFRVAPANELEVTVTERGRAHTVALPARWRAAEARGARRLLERAQATMRALSSVRERETVTSGPGTFALTRYRLRAPDRMAFTTGRGVEAVFIGRRQWLRTAGEPFRQRPPGAAPFRTREWFRWTPYARTVALLERRRERGGIIAEVALSDPATPVWSRLEIEEATGRVLRERLVAPARFVARRFEGFSAPVRIEAPREVAP